MIRSVRRAWPEAQIDVLVFDGTAGIIAGNPDIDRVLTMPQRPTAAESAAPDSAPLALYDVAVSTQSGDRPTVFAFAAAPWRVGVTTDTDRWLARALKRIALHRSVPAAEKLHRVEQIFASSMSSTFRAFLSWFVLQRAQARPLRQRQIRRIHAAPMFAYKEWTPDGWRAVAADLANAVSRLLRSAVLAKRSAAISKTSGAASANSISWNGHETMRLLSGACVYIGPDTSTTHLAAAAGCPTVALFGPTDPRVWGPWPVGGLAAPWQASGTIQNQGNVWIVQNPLPCMPCTFEGCERNIRSRSVCLDELKPEQVMAAVDQALA